MVIWDEKLPNHHQSVTGCHSGCLRVDERAGDTQGTHRASFWPSTHGPLRVQLVTVGQMVKNVVRKEIKKQKKQFPYVRALYNTSGHRVQAGIWQLFNSLHLKVTVAWQTCNQAGEDGGLYPSSGAASCNILRARMDLKRKKNNKTKQIICSAPRTFCRVHGCLIVWDTKWGRNKKDKRESEKRPGECQHGKRCLWRDLKELQTQNFKKHSAFIHCIQPNI